MSYDRIFSPELIQAYVNKYRNNRIKYILDMDIIMYFAKCMKTRIMTEKNASLQKRYKTFKFLDTYCEYEYGFYLTFMYCMTSLGKRFHDHFSFTQVNANCLQDYLNNAYLSLIHHTARTNHLDLWLQTTPSYLFSKAHPF